MISDRILKDQRTMARIAVLVRIETIYIKQEVNSCAGILGQLYNIVTTRLEAIDISVNHIQKLSSNVICFDSETC